MFLNVSGGRTLQILNAQEDNAGRYSCVATNEAGEMIKHYEVKVYSKFQKKALSHLFLKMSNLFFLIVNIDR